MEDNDDRKERMMANGSVQWQKQNVQWHKGEKELERRE
jgi:hypothetical protein